MSPPVNDDWCCNVSHWTWEHVQSEAGHLWAWFDLCPYQSSSLIRSAHLSHSSSMTSPLCLISGWNHRTTTVICGSVATKSYLKLPLHHIHSLCIPLFLAPGSSSIHTAGDVRWSTVPLCSWKRVGRGFVTSGLQRQSESEYSRRRQKESVEWG